MPEETVSVRLDEATLNRLGMIAAATGRSRATLMSHAIKEYAEIQARQVAAIREAADELSRGDADLVDHSEVSHWLDSWGTQNELEPPSCK